MRATMHQYLTSLPVLTDIVPPVRWYQAGNVVDTPVRPFVVVRWISPVALATSFGHQLRLDVHDNRGSYANIDSFRRAALTAMQDVEDLVGPDGRITQCDYLGHGGDQEDPDYGTNYSFTSWQVIGVEL